MSWFFNKQYANHTNHLQKKQKNHTNHYWLMNTHESEYIHKKDRQLWLARLISLSDTQMMPCRWLVMSLTYMSTWSIDLEIQYTTDYLHVFLYGITLGEKSTPIQHKKTLHLFHFEHQLPDFHSLCICLLVWLVG